MLKVKTSLQHERNQSRQTSFGKLQFDENGVSQDIESQKANRLVQVSGSLTLAEKGTKKPEKGTKKSEKGTKKSEKDQLRDKLSQKGIGEIRDHLAELGVEQEVFDKDEYKGKDGKVKLIEMLIQKLG